MNKLLKTCLTSALVVGSIALIFKALENKLTTRYYQYVHPSIAEPIRAVVIGDLHSNQYGDEQIELINKIKMEEPDIIFLVGDIIDEVLPQSAAEAFLSSISQKFPTYYVTGNHEYYTYQGEALKQLVKSYGIKVLDGKTMTFTKGESTLQISGIDDPEFAPIESQLQAARNQQLSIDSLKLLLAHRPELIEQYKQYNFDIVLSGHAHGGQWRIPGLINGIYAPGQGIFPKYAGGYFEIDRTTLCVTRGLETQKHWVPRIFNPPEIVVLDLLGD